MGDQNTVNGNNDTTEREDTTANNKDPENDNENLITNDHQQKSEDTAEELKEAFDLIREDATQNTKIHFFRKKELRRTALS